MHAAAFLSSSSLVSATRIYFQAPLSPADLEEACDAIRLTSHRIQTAPLQPRLAPHLNASEMEGLPVRRVPADRMRLREGEAQGDPVSLSSIAGGYAKEDVAMAELPKLLRQLKDFDRPASFAAIALLAIKAAPHLPGDCELVGPSVVRQALPSLAARPATSAPPSGDLAPSPSGPSRPPTAAIPTTQP